MDKPDVDFIEGLSPSEIGQIVSRSENSVSVQLNRAIKMLQEILHLWPANLKKNYMKSARR